jgi:hypothetical protein
MTLLSITEASSADPNPDQGAPDVQIHRTTKNKATRAA